MEQGLFQQFPCDEIYGMHNAPNGKPGQFEICKGRAMAGAAFFDIVITGLGSHAAMPQQSQDPVMIAAALVGQIQSIISRNVVPLETCVLSVTQIQASSAYNVVPERANLAGTIRYFEDQVYDTVTRRMQELCDGFGTAFGVEVALDLRPLFSVLNNDPDLSQAYLDAASDIVGTENVSMDVAPDTASEDFPDMLSGSGGLLPRGAQRDHAVAQSTIHSRSRDSAGGASIMARLVEKCLPLDVLKLEQRAVSFWNNGLAQTLIGVYQKKTVQQAKLPDIILKGYFGVREAGLRCHGYCEVSRSVFPDLVQQ
jgi:amidohydrolase